MSTHHLCAAGIAGAITSPGLTVKVVPVTRESFHWATLPKFGNPHVE